MWDLSKKEVEITAREDYDRVQSRVLDSLHFKLQQAINLKDDEISRLEDELAYLQGQIEVAQTKGPEIDEDLNSSVTILKKKIFKAQQKSALELSQTKTKFAQDMQQLAEAHQKQVKILRDQIENQLMGVAVVEDEKQKGDEVDDFLNSLNTGKYKMRSKTQESDTSLKEVNASFIELQKEERKLSATRRKIDDLKEQIDSVKVEIAKLEREQREGIKSTTATASTIGASKYGNRLDGTSKYGNQTDLTNKYDNKADATSKYGNQADLTGKYDMKTGATSKYGDTTNKYGNQTDLTGKYGNIGSTNKQNDKYDSLSNRSKNAKASSSKYGENRNKDADIDSYNDESDSDNGYNSKRKQSDARRNAQNQGNKSNRFDNDHNDSNSDSDTSFNDFMTELERRKQNSQNKSTNKSNIGGKDPNSKYGNDFSKKNKNNRLKDNDSDISESSDDIDIGGNRLNDTRQLSLNEDEENEKILRKAGQIGKGNSKQNSKINGKGSISKGDLKGNSRGAATTAKGNSTTGYNKKGNGNRKGRKSNIGSDSDNENYSENDNDSSDYDEGNDEATEESILDDSVLNDDSDSEDNEQDAKYEAQIEKQKKAYEQQLASIKAKHDKDVNRLKDQIEQQQKFLNDVAKDNEPALNSPASKGKQPLSMKTNQSRFDRTKSLCDELSKMTLQQKEAKRKQLLLENVTLKREIGRLDFMVYGKAGKYNKWRLLK